MDQVLTDAMHTFAWKALALVFFRSSFADCVLCYLCLCTCYQFLDGCIGCKVSFSEI